MNPQQLLDPATLPDDLRWVAAEFRLQPKDPVFLLIAWHWHHVQRAEDTLRAANVELQAAVDSRIERVAGAKASVDNLIPALAATRAALDGAASAMTATIADGLTGSLEKVRALEKSLSSVLAEAAHVNAQARRREILAALLSGVTIGVLGATILVLG